MNDNFFVYNIGSNSVETRPAKKDAENFLKFSIQTLICKMHAVSSPDIFPLWFSLYEEIMELLSKKPSNKLVNKMEFLCKSIKSDISSIRPFPKDFISLEHLKVTLTYQSLLAIVQILASIIEFIINGKNSKENLYCCFNEAKLEYFASKMPDKYTSKLLEDLRTIKKIKFRLVPDKIDYKIRLNINAIVLFLLFCPQIFYSAFKLSIDLNVYQLNSEYSFRQNPYKVTAEEIIKRGNVYKDNFILNFIILQELFKLDKVMRVSFNLCDSYQLELYTIFSNELIAKNQNNRLTRNVVTMSGKVNSPSSLYLNANNQSSFRGSFVIINNDKRISNLANILYEPNCMIDKTTSLENNLLYFNHLLMTDEKDLPTYLDYKIAFNSLDPLLFSTVNQLIFKNTNLGSLTIELFPEGKITFLRKILINKLYFDFYDSNRQFPLESKYNDEDKIFDIINIPYARILNDGSYIIKEEKIVDELFKNFNKNLLELSMIISEKLNDLSSLSLDLSSHSNSVYDIDKSDKYNCSLMCFVFNIFKAIQNYGNKLKLNQLEIKLDDYNDANIYIINKIKNNNALISKGFSLKNTHLTQLNFGMHNIFKIVSFENFPCGRLMSLKLSRLSYEDLESLTNKIMENSNMFPSLRIIELYLEYMLEDPLPLVKKFISNCILESFETVIIEFANSFKFSDIFELMRAIHGFKSKNEKVKFILKLHNEEFFYNIKTLLFSTSILEYFAAVLQRDLCFTYNAENLSSVELVIQKLNKEKVNKYLSIIYCMDKIGEIPKVSNELKKNICNIYNKVCYYLGDLKIKAKVRIEII